MRRDSRLSQMLHVLLHMARHPQPFTSEQISVMLQSNPVVVRRTMAGLRSAGYVHSAKGHGGSWTLAVAQDDLALLDIHNALDGPRIFAIGNGSGNPACAVERAVNAALDGALRDAEALLLKRLGTVTLAELARGMDAPQPQCYSGATPDGWGPKP